MSNKQTIKIAKERIEILLNLARTDPTRAQRYTQLALKIASRTRTRLTKNQQRAICPQCKTLRTAQTSRTRIRQRREPHIALTCLKCGYITRIPIKGRKS